ncbi:MAG TPA: MFS transporter [Bradyrhizobium sp.]|uniref:MFS transporter n=1 Tax=Bradyrhizobium sp. TaxID=376 RepID=UPI002D7E8B1A|nr:MFS transporter [Bradyrhizobium sp.]HET7887327.1 MFS transporter [Bradyrhizobium sp.]
MRSRWFALAVLFLIRLTMAFQFQSVAAVAPLLNQKFGVSLADIGWLIGLYFAPGLFLALPGGAIGKRLGDKPTVIVSLLLMLLGELAMALSSTWINQIAGRLVSGAGGVMFNVQMTKMVADWFVGREIATAMAIFVNSWPAGIALSLILLPLIATAFGVEAVHLTVAASIALGLVFFAAAYPSSPKIAAAAPGSWPDRKTLIALIAAGLIWGLFNLGFAMIFSFGPSMLDERGWSISAAGPVISIVLWLAVVSVPLGGILADRTGRPDLVLAVGCFVFAALMVVLPRTDAVVSVVTGIGLLSGLPVGPIMSLPARILKAETRAIGMGIFYTLYYGTMMLGPAVAGALAKSTGHTASAIDFGTVVILACPLLLWAFNRLAEAQPKIA